LWPVTFYISLKEDKFADWSAGGYEFEDIPPEELALAINIPESVTSGTLVADEEASTKDADLGEARRNSFDSASTYDEQWGLPASLRYRALQRSEWQCQFSPLWFTRPHDYPNVGYLATQATPSGLQQQNLFISSNNTRAEDRLNKGKKHYS
jgi:hypothetical protein